MHRALVVLDLLYEIGGCLLVNPSSSFPIHDGLRFACTCKSIWVVVKPLVWRNVPTSAVHSVLPADVQVPQHPPDASPLIYRSLTIAEQDRLLYYCQDIRTLSLQPHRTTWADNKQTASVFYIHEAFREQGVIFNVREINLELQHGALVPLAMRLLFPTMTALTITVGEYALDILEVSSTVLVQNLQACCVKLRHLHIGTSHSGGFLKPDKGDNTAVSRLTRIFASFGPLVASLPHLRVVHLSPISSDSPLLFYLSTSSTLEELKLGIIDLPTQSDYLLDPNAFPSLYRLEVLGYGDDRSTDTTHLLSAISSPFITSLTVACCTEWSVTRALRLVAKKWSSSVENLHVYEYFERSRASPSPIAIADHLRQLLRPCRLLTKFQLTTKHGLEIDEQATQDLPPN